jgi:hypothetical protein
MSITAADPADRLDPALLKLAGIVLRPTETGAAEQRPPSMEAPGPSHA